jgi:predicted TPR repeat methyltransferase
MHGVDLSGKMLEHARRKNVYTSLHQMSISSYLDQCRPDAYDLVIAADVFNYIGELGELFSALHRVSRGGGFFFFTVEDLADKGGSMRLESSGRFTHSNSYILTAAQRSRWQIFLAHKLNLRREKGEWVRGSLYGLKKMDV